MLVLSNVMKSNHLKTQQFWILFMQLKDKF